MAYKRSMKPFAHALFAFAVAVASCQCAVMAAPADATVMAEACHDVGDMQDVQTVHSGIENCCEQPGTLADTHLLKVQDQDALQPEYSLVAAKSGAETEAFTFARHQQPPPSNTPVSRHDQILS